MVHTADLDLQTQMHTIFIQTDKAIYKPNDCIKYRVLVLNAELKAAPINNNELSIEIVVSNLIGFFVWNTFLLGHISNGTVFIRFV